MSREVETSRNWNVTYAAVIATEIVCLLLLWWLGRRFGI
jgi:hypothetical protein